LQLNITFDRGRRDEIITFVPSEGVTINLNLNTYPIEIETPNDLFFAITLPKAQNNGELRTEIMSVNENKVSEKKYVYLRKTYNSKSGEIAMICENGRSIRLQAIECSIPYISFCFYDEYIEFANKITGWEDLGKFALSLMKDEVFHRLEPENDMINGRWPRFNDDAFVNIKNYQDKWEASSSDPDDRNISQVVRYYIQLSDQADNPKANEHIFVDVTEDDGEPMMTSLLEVLNAGAMDFHIARMLGLGTIDIRVEGPQLHIYAAEYFSEGDLKDGAGDRTAQHVYLSLPTSIYTERLPKIVDITKIVPVKKVIEITF